MKHHGASRHSSKCSEHRARARAHTPAWARVAATGCAVMALGCSSDDSEPAGGDGVDPMVYLEPALACGAPTFVACDVLDPGCQQALADVAACQWGGAGTAAVLPPIAAATSASLSPAEVASDMAVREMMAASDAAMTATDMASDPDVSQQAFGAVFDWLGLAPPSATTTEATTELLDSLLLASYAFATKQITLEVDALAGDARIDDELLLHELVHAQQDARYDLTSFTSDIDSLDSFIAKRAVFEGEATFHQTLFSLAMFDVPVNPNNVNRALLAVRAAQEEGWLSEPATAWTSSIFVSSYIYGQFLVRDWWFEGGPDAMVRLYAGPPRETLRMLEAAFGRETSTGRIWPYPSANVFVAPGESPPMPGDERLPLGSDRLGAWTVYMLAQLAGDSGLSQRLGLGWRGDQIDAFQLADGSFAGRWRVSFDTTANASAFVQLLAGRENVQTQTNASFVSVVASELAEIPDWLFGPAAAP